MIYRRRLQILAATAILSAAACGFASTAEPLPGPTTAEEQLLALQKANQALNLRIEQLETEKKLPTERLRHKKIQRLKELAADVRLQRQSTADFEQFVKWMSTHLAGYNRYIQAGSYVAVAARMLPIPYAGQASLFTKFAAQFTLSLNAASLSVNNYLSSSQKFLIMAEGIEKTASPSDRAIADASTFADRQLLKDMHDASAKLKSVSELSSGALSFLESVNHYASGTDEYWNKAKGLFTKTDQKEKSFLSENIGNLKSQADRFNGRLRNFEDLAQKETASVKALAVYEELLQDTQANLFQ